MLVQSCLSDSLTRGSPWWWQQVTPGQHGMSQWQSQHHCLLVSALQGRSFLRRDPSVSVPKPQASPVVPLHWVVPPSTLVPLSTPLCL